MKNSCHFMDAAQVCTTLKTDAGGHTKRLPEMSQTTIKMKTACNLHKKWRGNSNHTTAQTATCLF